MRFWGHLPFKHLSESSLLAGSLLGGLGLPFSRIHIISSILLPLRQLLPSVFQYDLLLCHPDPFFLTYCTHYAVHLLQSAGFLLNQKSIFVPTHTIEWLGKHIRSSPSCHIKNPSSKLAALFSTLVDLFLRPLSHRRLFRVLGVAQWLARPASEVAIFLAPVYHLAQRPTLPRYFPLKLWQPLF